MKCASVIIFLSALLLTGSSLKAESRLDTAIMTEPALTSRFYPLTFSTPVGLQFRRPFSLNSIESYYRHSGADKEYESMTGTGFHRWGIEAKAYMKHKSSTLVGHAGYENGVIRHIRWNETSDPEILFPYLTADAIGGDMKKEHYSFSGGYSDLRNKWSWGAIGGYDAGLYYRDVDPRPKNLTGNLHVGAGAGYLIAKDYMLQADLEFRKYRQTNEIRFVSEMGESKIYHLTGNGTHYVRFAGNGQNAHYDGYTLGGGISLLPGYKSGFLATARWEHFNFHKTLVDLNKIPICSASENTFEFEGGYRHLPKQCNAYNLISWAIKGGFKGSKRSGVENIFGDPSANIYPMTGSREMFHATTMKAEMDALFQIEGKGGKMLALQGGASWERLHTNYVDPLRYLTINTLDLQLNLLGTLMLPFKIFAEGNLTGNISKPLKSILYISSGRLDDDSQLLTFFRSGFERVVHRELSTGINLALTRVLISRLALRVNTSFQHSVRKECGSSDEWSLALSFLFL